MCCCSITVFIIPLWRDFFAKVLLVGRTSVGIERVPDKGSFDEIMKRPSSDADSSLLGGGGHDLEYALSHAVSEDGVTCMASHSDADVERQSR